MVKIDLFSEPLLNRILLPLFPVSILYPGFFEYAIYILMYL